MTAALGTSRESAGFDDQTALIVVDVQNDFVDPKGTLHVEGGEQVVPTINALVGDAHLAGSIVVYTADWHPPSTPHFRKDGGTWPVHCVRGSWGAELHPKLVVEGPVVRKGAAGQDGYSGFTQRDPQSGQTAPTELEQILRTNGVHKVVIAGLATDWCVKETAVDAKRLGFEATVIADATRAVNLEPDARERALAALTEAGVDVR